MDAIIKRRLTVKVEHYPAIGRNGYNDIIFGPPVERMSYPVGKIQTVRTTTGKDVVSMQHLFFDGPIPVTSNDDFVVYGNRYKVLAYQYYQSPFDSGKTVVYL